MRNLLRKGLMLTLVLVLVVTAGCTAIQRGDTSPGEGTQGDASANPVKTDKVVIQGTLNDQTLVATVHPIEVMDGYVVLTVEYLVPEDSASSDTLILDAYMGRGAVDFTCSEVRLVDTETGRVWLPGYYPESNTFHTIASQPGYIDGGIRLKPGESKISTTVFPFVDTDTVDVLFPWLGFAYDVPVVEGNADTPIIESFNVSAAGTEYNEKSHVAFHEPQTLSPFVKSYDNAQSTTKEGNQQRVILASDVLFAFDVYTLSDSAGARVDQVGEEIAEAASGGEIKVIGHTDDVGTEAYNLDLSNKRARSVAERLKAKLDTSFSIISEGKGESSPAIEGTNEEARKANRRVEIAFTSDQGLDISKNAKISGNTQIPTAETPVATGHNSVEYEYKEHESLDKTYMIRVSVPSVQKRGNYLVGSVTVSNIGESLNSAMLPAAMGPGWEMTQQSYHNSFIGLAARSITLLTPGGRLFPAQYTVRTEEKSPEKMIPYMDILADRHIWTDFKPGNSLIYTVVWPDTGQDTVTIDVPDRFRITDIPVEGR